MWCDLMVCNSYFTPPPHAQSNKRLIVVAGFAGAVPVEGEAEGEERMSVSAALQRFRRMERLSKEQRALAEQQQAVLDAQRQQALTHRHSGAGGSGTGSPSVCGLPQNAKDDARLCILHLLPQLVLQMAPRLYPVILISPVTYID